MACSGGQTERKIANKDERCGAQPCAAGYHQSRGQSANCQPLRTGRCAGRWSATRRLAHKRQMSTDEVLSISLFCSSMLLAYAYELSHFSSERTASVAFTSGSGTTLRQASIPAASVKRSCKRARLGNPLPTTVERTTTGALATGKASPRRPIP